MWTHLLLGALAPLAAIALPGAPPVAMDYLAYDAAHERVWVPAGNTGKVDVIDTPTGKLTTIEGFATADSARPGRPRMGPSSASVGEGVVFIGNRADRTVCAFDAVSLAKQSCTTIPAMPDGLQYVGPTGELWVTTPGEKALTIVDVKGSAAPATLPVEGEPEGYALDAAAGVFYTNLEDQNRTLAIDVKARRVLSRWETGCNGDGPRGLAIDAARRLLFVACTDGARVLDLGAQGKVVGHLQTGKGVDNIDYLAARHALYVASREDGMLTVAEVAKGGAIAASRRFPTDKGGRNAVADSQGTAYVPVSATGKILVVKIPAR